MVFVFCSKSETRQDEDEKDTETTFHKASPTKSSYTKPKEKIIQPQANADYNTQSFLPWNDHGSSKATKPPLCNCQRVVVEESDNNVEEKASIFVVNPFFIGFLISLICGAFLL